MNLDVKGCPHCGARPVERSLQNVYGFTTGRILECPNADCEGRKIGIGRNGYPLFAYNEAEWNALEQRH